METSSPNFLCAPATPELLWRTPSQQEIQERAEAIFPELRQIALARGPEERALAVSALRGRLASERARDKTS
jgi:hypothetical protein